MSKESIKKRLLGNWIRKEYSWVQGDKEKWQPLAKEVEAFFRGSSFKYHFALVVIDLSNYYSATNIYDDICRDISNGLQIEYTQAVTGPIEFLVFLRNLNNAKSVAVMFTSVDSVKGVDEFSRILSVIRVYHCQVAFDEVPGSPIVFMFFGECGPLDFIPDEAISPFNIVDVIRLENDE